MRAANAGKLALVLALGGVCSCALELTPLYAKMVEECSIRGAGPECGWVNFDDRIRRFTFDRWAHRVVDPFEYACMMDVDCTQRSDRVVDEFRACLGFSTSTSRDSNQDPRTTCLTACGVEVESCGNPSNPTRSGARSECSTVQIDACFRRWDGCRDWCDLTLGGDEKPQDGHLIQLE